MTTARHLPKPDVNAPVLNSPALVYADQIAQLAIGPFVTKLTLGMDDGVPDVVPRPVVTIVMPTQALLQLADSVRAAIATPLIKTAIVDAQAVFQTEISTIKA
ncbi:hypothetical protein P3W85_30075 [Cupriavidus basilensis]|uniref:Uncharacterized protein n=1 Tax=Cupriavidus basilensis TaxID=68895 RepID=A0ABT6AX41_9BURK|nr:hypothetical protein [Cupriavidus basilensis]MDF3837172.1 hypothetical protein [Cupriavidus basilensis]